MTNDNNYISHGNDGEKHSKLTRFKTLHVNIIECNRYQKRLTRSIHEVGFDQNHAIEDDGERAMSNNNNYISHENEERQGIKADAFCGYIRYYHRNPSLSKEIDASDSRSRF